MAGTMIEFPSNGQQTPGYLAIPESGSGPGVVVIQEWWGLVGHITDVADRFAAAAGPDGTARAATDAAAARALAESTGLVGRFPRSSPRGRRASVPVAA